MNTELKEKIDKFTAELNDSNIAFICVVMVQGTKPRWWTNLQRYHEDVIGRVRQTLNECGHAIVDQKNKGRSNIILPSDFPRA